MSSAASRILLLNERDLRHPRAGGAETHVFEIMSRLVGAGMRVTQLAVGFPGGAAAETVDGVDGPPARRRCLATTRRRPSRCARETRRGRFDVVVECLNKLPFFSPALLRRARARALPSPVRRDRLPPGRLADRRRGRRRRALHPRRLSAAAASSRSPRARATTSCARGIARERIDVSLPGIRRPRVAPRPLARAARRASPTSAGSSATSAST